MPGTSAWTPAVQHRDPAVQLQALPRHGCTCPVSAGILSECPKGKAAATFGDNWSLLTHWFLLSYPRDSTDTVGFLLCLSPTWCCAGSKYQPLCSTVASVPLVWPSHLLSCLASPTGRAMLKTIVLSFHFGCFCCKPEESLVYPESIFPLPCQLVHERCILSLQTLPESQNDECGHQMQISERARK